MTEPSQRVRTVRDITEKLCHIALDNGTELRSSWTTDKEKTNEELRDESVIGAAGRNPRAPPQKQDRCKDTVESRQLEDLRAPGRNHNLKWGTLQPKLSGYDHCPLERRADDGDICNRESRIDLD